MSDCHYASTVEDLKEFKELLKRLEKEKSQETVKDMVLIIDEHPSFARHVPVRLRKLFSEHKINWRAASMDSDFTTMNVIRELVATAMEITGMARKHDVVKILKGEGVKVRSIDQKGESTIVKFPSDVDAFEGQMFLEEEGYEVEPLSSRQLMVAREVIGGPQYEVGDIVVVKQRGREIEDVVEDLKMKGGKWIYKLEKTKDPVPQEELRWASDSRDVSGMDDIAEALIEVAEALAGGISKTAASRPWSPGVMKAYLKEMSKPVRQLGHSWKKVSTAISTADRSLAERPEVYTALLDARDYLNAVRDLTSMVSGRIDGALQYVETAE